MTQLTLHLVAAGIGAAIAAIVALAWLRLSDRRRQSRRELLREAEGSITFLFDGEDLIDATRPAQDLIRYRQPGQSDWEALVALVSVRFPEFRSRITALGMAGAATLDAENRESGRISAETWDGYTRITLVTDRAGQGRSGVDALTFEAVEDELETLRALGNEAPFPVWKQDASGVITWANRAFLSLSALMDPGKGVAPSWPPLPVFDVPIRVNGTDPVVGRKSLDLPGRDDPAWFEVTTVQRGTGTMHFALDADASVQAETAQRQFVQTLSKTFAQLTVGIAIFDRDRNLVMFNPALLTLTGLPADFLVGRPRLTAVLDRLRQRQMIPEPPDYQSWRDRFAALESAAEDGTYSETWPLSNGRTYRVTGRPHPDGAIAFLFEDISAEMSLTRRFRSQIEIAHGALDEVEEAIAIFSDDRRLLHTNRAYRALWTNDDDETLTQRRFEDELATWTDAATPSRIWDDLRIVAAPGTRRKGWSGQVPLADGRMAALRAVPLPNGALLISLRPGGDEHALVEAPRSIGAGR